MIWVNECFVGSSIFGKGCFVNCPKLNREEYPEIQKNDEEYFNEAVKEEHQQQLEEWTELKCDDILFDSKIDEWSENTSVFNERIIGKSKLTFDEKRKVLQNITV